jgi:ABC-2 type transport system permease protein
MNEPITVNRSELQVVSGRWLRGFKSIYAKELAAWFRTPRWATQLIIWLALAALPPILITPQGTNGRGEAILALFLWSGSNMMSIGTVILTQGAIIEEKMSQTLLWVFSKPLSPAGFILGKFAAYAVLIGLLVLGIPAMVTYVAAIVMGLSGQISVFNYLAGIWMLYLVLLFVLALTILMGVLFDRTPAVTALSLVIFLSGPSLQSNPHLRWISWLEPYTVWALQHNSSETLIGKFPSTAWIAMASTLFTIGLLLSAAIWRMRRSEI